MFSLVESKKCSVLVQSENCSKFFFYLSIPIDINDDSGIYHLIEHILARSASDYFTKGNISGRHVFQATTDYHSISFYFSAPYNLVVEAFHILLESFSSCSFTPEFFSNIIEQERISLCPQGRFKGIIYDEISSYIKNPLLLIQLFYLRTNYKSLPYGFFNEGYPSAMAALSADDVYSKGKSLLANLNEWTLVTNVGCCYRKFKVSNDQAENTDKESLNANRKIVSITSPRVSVFFLEIDCKDKIKSSIILSILDCAVKTPGRLKTFLYDNKFHSTVINNPSLKGLLLTVQKDIDVDYFCKRIMSLFQDFLCRSTFRNSLLTIFLSMSDFESNTLCNSHLKLKSLKRNFSHLDVNCLINTFNNMSILFHEFSEASFSIQSILNTVTINVGPFGDVDKGYIFTVNES